VPRPDPSHATSGSEQAGNRGHQRSPTDSANGQREPGSGGPAQRGRPGTGQARRRLVVGPLDVSAIAVERMRKLVALPVLSADALSSVAYGPQAMLAVLVMASWIKWCL
jgi:hypothetical protein